MDSKNIFRNQPVGVLGAGSFGAVVANLLAKNRNVYLFTRRQEVVDTILKEGCIRGQQMNKRITPTTDIALLADSCNILFPVVRATNFRDMMRDLSPYLRPDHIIIHGTKGFDVSDENKVLLYENNKLNRSQIKTMSEVVMEESVVKRVGCFSGPNLAQEIVEQKLAGTVLASHFEEVIQEGKFALESENFKVYENKNLLGVELAGALKNILAIASGSLNGLGYGENAKAMLISRGLAEMITIGKMLGESHDAFLGLAGIGDLIATCSSTKSRNYSVGYRIAQGENLADILASMNDVVEGIETIKIVNALANHYTVRIPITQMLHKVLFDQLPVKEAINYLITLPMNKDVGFLA